MSGLGCLVKEPYHKFANKMLNHFVIICFLLKHFPLTFRAFTPIFSAIRFNWIAKDGFSHQVGMGSQWLT